MTSQNNQLAKWEDVRKKGFLRFVLVQGVLRWGVGTAILYTLFTWLVAHTNLLKVLSLSLVIFPICGIFFGIIMWFVLQRNYQKKISAQASAQGGN